MALARRRPDLKHQIASTSSGLFSLDLLGLPFKSKSQLAAENAALRRQAIVSQRKLGVVSIHRQ